MIYNLPEIPDHDCRMSPIDISTFSLSGIGECAVRIIPYEDDQKPPIAHLIKRDDDSEICSIRLLESSVIPSDSLSLEQKKELTKVLTTPIFDELTGLSITPFNSLWLSWFSMNGYYSNLKVPEELPDYTKY